MAIDDLMPPAGLLIVSMSPWDPSIRPAELCARVGRRSPERFGIDRMPDTIGGIDRGVLSGRA